MRISNNFSVYNAKKSNKKGVVKPSFGALTKNAEEWLKLCGWNKNPFFIKLRNDSFIKCDFRRTQMTSNQHYFKLEANDMGIMEPFKKLKNILAAPSFLHGGEDFEDFYDIVSLRLKKDYIEHFNKIKEQRALTEEESTLAKKAKDEVNELIDSLTPKEIQRKIHDFVSRWQQDNQISVHENFTWDVSSLEKPKVKHNTNMPNELSFVRTSATDSIFE